MTRPIWSLLDVTLAGRVRPRLSNVSLEISSGVTAVMGSSGAGKSSLLGLLAQFEEPESGTVEFHVPPSAASLPLFWSPQDDGLWPHLDVKQHLEYVRPSTPRIDRSVLQWLELFGLAALKDSLPELLSQGERSRLAVVRTLASEASVIVLDEPLVYVDPFLARECWKVIAEHVQQFCTAAIFSTHNADAVLGYSQNVICLQDGTAAFHGTVESLYHEPPTNELAWLLGPCNWFDNEDRRQELARCGNPPQHKPSSSTGAGEWPVCVRPSNLTVLPDADSRLTVESIAHAATVSEWRLCHRDSNSHHHVIVSRIARKIEVGDTVQLALLPRSGASLE